MFLGSLITRTNAIVHWSFGSTFHSKFRGNQFWVKYPAQITQASQTTRLGFCPTPAPALKKIWRTQVVIAESSEGRSNPSHLTASAAYSKGVADDS